MATTTRRKAAAPVTEPEEVETDEFEEMDDDEPEDGDELEELEDGDEDEAPAPKTKGKAKASGTKAAAKPAAPVIEFGSPWLAAHVTEVTGETYDSRGIRMLLRKLARDGKHNRVVGEDRARYSFTGPEDATVKAVVAMIQSGAAKELKQAGLQAVKDKAAAKKAAAAKAKAAEAEDEGDDMEEVEDEPTPAPKRRATAAKPAPAKATPATAARRRTAAAK